MLRCKDYSEGQKGSYRSDYRWPHPLAKREVIFSAGALNNPQLLLLSGVGPRHELEKHSLPVYHELPLVGQTLCDHPSSRMGIVAEQGSEFVDHNSPVGPTPMGFFKSQATLGSEEYKQLPEEVKRLLQSSTVPNFEIATVRYVCLLARID